MKDSLSKWRRVGFTALFAAALSVTALAASGNGVNQTARAAWRLDSHTGTVMAGAQIPVYRDEACTVPATDAEGHTHYIRAGDWVVRDGEANPAVTYPVTVDSHDTPDAGHSFAQYYMRASDWAAYVADAAGSFGGDTWDVGKWFNGLPTSISYTAQRGGGTVFVSNNTGFQVQSAGNGYYRLVTSGGAAVDSASPNPDGLCFYDPGDLVNADYLWSPAAQASNTANLHQGVNTVYYAGMDDFGNFATGQRNLKWDTLAPIMATNLSSLGHSGWLNLADFDGGESCIIKSREDTSQTTDVSGLNTASLQTAFDGATKLGNAQGYQGFDSFDGTNWVKTIPLRTVMQALGANGGTGGQGAHQYVFSSSDNAGNTASIGNIVSIDTVPPTCQVSGGESDWRTGTSPVTLTFSDNASGVATQQYVWTQSAAIPAGGWQGYSGGQLTAPGGGSWYLHWRAVDVAGNVGTGTFGPYSVYSSLDLGIQTPNAAYLTDTDVITSVNVSDNSMTPVLPGEASVSFTVRGANGTVYTSQGKSFVCPSGGSDLIWFRWHTPSAPGNVTMTATVYAANVGTLSGWSSSMTWNIQTPTENAPPQTGLTDTRPAWFSVQSPTPNGYSSTLSWGDWTYVYLFNGKFWYGVFEYQSYTASLSAGLTVTPTKAADGSNRIVTAAQTGGGWTMKAGYGISESATSGVSLWSSTGSAVDGSAITSAQFAEGRYPEFNYYYAGYYRLLDSTGGGGFQLKQNPYSEYGFRTHYIPVWYPDGPYTALVTVSQAWTPAGMLARDVAGTVQIRGALPDDWYVKETP